MNVVQQAVLEHLPYNTKSSAGGWNSFNAVCCIHNGETPDKRRRGGIICSDDGAIAYHCFNCQFKASWRPGLTISYKFKKLLSWLGIYDSDLSQLQFAALKLKEDTSGIDNSSLPVNRRTAREKYDFNEVEFPENLTTLDDAPEEIRQYVAARKLDSQKILWANSLLYAKRIIVPFTWYDKIVGYSARIITPEKSKTKYINKHDPGYVYGYDNQPANAAFALVSDGVLDALSLNGMAVLSQNCSTLQAELINTMASEREMIVVPDHDPSGKYLIDDAIKYQWTVSYPTWHPEVKDINDAVVKYGKLFTLKSILESRYSGKLTLELLKRRIVNETKKK